MPTNDDSSDVTNHYVFKQRLQEYAQKVGFPAPVYETVEEGPPHEHIFRSTVVVNGVKYYSMPGFFDRKAAEQSASEVAIIELARSSGEKGCISAPVHETGLCKDLLQGYALKMNYAPPIYECRKDGAPGRGKKLLSCTVEIGGIQYIGAAAKTKKEAELKAATAALLAIQSRSSGLLFDNSRLTVFPVKKSGVELAVTRSALKPKEGNCKTKNMEKQRPSDGFGAVEASRVEGALTSHTNVELQPLKVQSVASNGDQSNQSMAPNADQSNQSVAPNADQSNLSRSLQRVKQLMKERRLERRNNNTSSAVEAALKPKKAKCKKTKKKAAKQMPSGVLGTEDASRVEGTLTPHANDELHPLKVQSVAPNGDQGNQSVASSGDQINLSSSLQTVKQVMEKIRHEQPCNDTSNAVEATLKPKKAKCKKRKKKTARRVEGTLTPHANDELQPLKVQSVAPNGDQGNRSVASSGDQSNLSSSLQTVNQVMEKIRLEQPRNDTSSAVEAALKPQKAKYKRKKKMAKQIPNDVLGAEEARRVEGTLTPHTNGELQPLKVQSVASNGDQTKMSSSLQTVNQVMEKIRLEQPRNDTSSAVEVALKPKKAKCKKRKKKTAEQIPSDVLGAEEASRVEGTQTPHTNSEMQTLKGQPVASNDETTKQIPKGMLGAEKASKVEDAPTPHTNGQMQTLKGQPVASSDDQSNPSGLVVTLGQVMRHEQLHKDTLNAGEVAIDGTVNGQVAVEVAIAMAGLDQSCESIQTRAD